MEEYKFKNISNGLILTMKAMSFESAYFLLIQSVKHPGDWVYVEPC